MLSSLALNGYLWLAWAVYWFVAARFVSSRKFTEHYVARLLHSLPLGFGMYLIFGGLDFNWLHQQLYADNAPRWLGMALTVTGLLFAVWARIHLGRNWSGIITLKMDHRLIRTGPYQYVRHPIYTGFFVAALGSALVAARADAFIGVCFVLIAFLVKIRREEALLVQEFGDQYRVFQREVPALMPLIRC